MAVEGRIEAVGLKDALRELNTLDKRARRQVTKDFREVAAPAVNAGTKLIPTHDQIPSGFFRNWTPRHSSRGFKREGRNLSFKYGTPGKPLKMDSKLSGKRPKESIYGMKNLATFSIVLRGGGDVILDLTGVGKNITPQGRRMAAALDGKIGRTPSRITWRAYDEHADEIEANMQKLIDRVMRDLNEARKFWKTKSHLTGGLNT